MSILPPAPIQQPEPFSASPYYVRDRQPWAVEQERQRHLQALYSVGEYAMFALMWHTQDFTAGLVERCNHCYGSANSMAEKIANVYEQPTQNKCPDCYGTTFEGGWKALIIRPAIFADTDESEIMDRRGVVHPTDIDIESTSDFRVRSGDYAFRADGDRFQLGVPQRITLRTGFAIPHQTNAAIGYNHAAASYEDPAASVCYDIGPDPTALNMVLTMGSRFPEDFSQFESIRSPLIPEGD